MKDYGIGRLLIAALTVGMLGLPYAKPAVCAMGGQEAMSSECDECDESAPNEGDDQSCDEFAASCMAGIALSAAVPADVPTLPISSRHELLTHRRILGNLQPPLTPPPRA